MTMLQSENVRLQSFNRAPAPYGSNSLQQKRRAAILDSSTISVSQLQELVPSNISQNKEAVIERLITLWTEGTVR